MTDFNHLPTIGLRDRPDIANVRNIDAGCLPMTRHMHRVGMTIDLPYLEEVGSQFGERIASLRKSFISSIPYDKLELFNNRFGISQNPNDPSAYTADIEDPESFEIESPLTENPEADEKASKTIDAPKAFDINVDGINLGSAQQVAYLLIDVLGVGEGLQLQRTKQGAISTGKKNIEVLLRGATKYKELFQTLKQYKELVKLKQTYCNGLPNYAIVHERSDNCSICGFSHKETVTKVHPRIGTTEARTGRCNCTDPNLQNIPARTSEGKLIRAAFVAEPGYVLISNDYSQIELRGLAMESGDPFMLWIYANGKDLHIMTTLDMYDYPLDTDTSKIDGFDDLRRGAKTINFGIVYGLSARGLQAALMLLGIIKSEEECQAMINRWFAGRMGVKHLMDYYVRLAQQYHATWTNCGRIRLIYETYSDLYQIRAEGFRRACNHPIQGSAADLMKVAMRNLHEYFQNMDKSFGLRSCVVIHDEHLCQVPLDKNPQEACDTIAYIMETALPWTVKIVADGKVIKPVNDRYCWTK